MTPPPDAASLAEPVLTYATDVGATITTAASLYVARQARRIVRRLERYDLLLFGDDKIDGRDGIANIALENERRSLENREALRDRDQERVRADLDPSDD